ncbi:hypothetical protein [Sphingomonas faeni]|uniref:hypothetical protein n=1 Tax=Sphingomonas faeni TaxID=185950 RepID=UPI0020C815BA|nr:hypothetical protein [Sphingomonas faeni]MCP8891867.1 hypothetical protein [Sphingomonas faeni]
MPGMISAAGTVGAAGYPSISHSVRFAIARARNAAGGGILWTRATLAPIRISRIVFARRNAARTGAASYGPVAEQAS